MEPLLTIAIPDNAGATARAMTLTSLERHTPQPHEVVLFVEGQLNHRTIAPARQQQTWHFPVPMSAGIPFALNRLLEASTTPYILLLESGAVVTDGWLQRLLAPLQDAEVGLSGPSTNICWNEQQVVPHGLGTHWSIAQIEKYATEVASRYAGQQQGLDTLHSLSDFCYLFKREVVEALGNFDEAYGAGPCWEIDFNTRAARAGYRAVWVGDAYVHRSYRAFPPGWNTLFAANKQLYQDRFCGLRLRGEKRDYEEHCRGEECEHFAPTALIQIKLERRGAMHCALSPSSPAETANLPLISCIMPTQNRRAFVRQSLLYFERQDYPNKELIIVDDGDDPVADLVASHPLVRYIALPQKKSIGEKRNIACELARGTIIAHWDDDDWYAPHRLSYQVAPLLAKQADVTALETSCFFDLPNWQAWTCSPELHRRLFVRDVHGGTLVYWRNIWGPNTRYPHQSLAEDALFLQLVCNRGARLQKMPHACSFAYVRHSSNAWNIAPGSSMQSAGWQRADLHDFIPSDDLTFYIPFSLVASASTTTTTVSAPPSRLLQLPSMVNHAIDTPLVSCIMPTCNRRSFVRQAIAYFLRQDYPHKELIIVDDGSEAVDDLVPPDANANIRYIRLPAKTVLGTKRNVACEHAQGSIIAHWDDDDWHAPHRLRYQVEALLGNKADICGIDRLLFYDVRSGLAWQYAYPPNQQAWVSGSTLCYQRAFWANNRFESINIGEDARFVWHNVRARVQTLPNTTFHIGIIHASNVSPKHTNGPLWRAYPANEVRALLGDDLGFYDAISQKVLS
jgi:glycosyltransferase involved in cell wall biosynthesis